MGWSSDGRPPWQALGQRSLRSGSGTPVLLEALWGDGGCAVMSTQQMWNFLMSEPQVVCQTCMGDVRLVYERSGPRVCVTTTQRGYTLPWAGGDGAPDGCV